MLYENHMAPSYVQHTSFIVSCKDSHIKFYGRSQEGTSTMYTQTPTKPIV